MFLLQILFKRLTDKYIALPRFSNSGSNIFYSCTCTQPVISSERQENNEGGLNLILFLCWKVQTSALLPHANPSLCFVLLIFCTVTGLGLRVLTRAKVSLIPMRFILFYLNTINGQWERLPHFALQDRALVY